MLSLLLALLSMVIATGVFVSFFIFVSVSTSKAGSSSSDVLTSKDISASQSDITSIIHQTNQSMCYTQNEFAAEFFY